MPRTNLRSVDLNLLTVFEAVYEERSQIKASERLAMSQPAISHALNRLRHLTGYRLFMARPKGLEPSPEAAELYIRVHRALDEIREELAKTNEFDPASSERTFVIAMVYGGGSVLGVRLYRRLIEQAPGVRLIIRIIDPSTEIPRLLREQKIDIAIHSVPFDDDALEFTPGLENRYVIMVSAAHPRINEKSSFEDWVQEQFVTVYNTEVYSDNDAVRKLLDIMNHGTVLEVPNAHMLAQSVAETDLLAITPLSMAELFSNHYPVHYYSLPLELPVPPSVMIWHSAMTSNQAHAWFRAQCQAVIDEVNGEGRASSAEGRA